MALVNRDSELKRTPMPARTTPLARSTIGRNAGPKLPTKRPRVQPAVPPKVRAALATRSGGLCEMALPGCALTATDPAHRLKTGAGGRHGAAKLAHDVLSNLTHACRPCHSWTHAEPARARLLGLMLREGDNPLTEWVLYRGVRSWLTDDGAVLASPPAVAS